jgi:hypothetical protein
MCLLLNYCYRRMHSSNSVRGKNWVEFAWLHKMGIGSLENEVNFESYSDGDLNPDGLSLMIYHHF